MKKLLFAGIVFLLLACEEYGAHDNIIYNVSSFDITFSLKKTDTYTVQSGKLIAVKNQIGAVVENFESNIPKRVEYIQTDTRKGKFVDLQSIPVKVYNTLSIPVTLSAGGYLGVDPMPNVQADENNTNIVFSRNPVFMVTTNSFPATIDFQIINNTMYVTIR